MLKGAKSTTLRVPTLVIWGMKDSAILTGHLSGLEKLVPNLWVKLYPDDHWIILAKNLQLAQGMRRFIDAQATFPKESVYRGPAR